MTFGICWQGFMSMKSLCHNFLLLLVFVGSVSCLWSHCATTFSSSWDLLAAFHVYEVIVPQLSPPLGICWQRFMSMSWKYPETIKGCSIAWQRRLCIWMKLDGFPNQYTPIAETNTSFHGGRASVPSWWLAGTCCSAADANTVSWCLHKTKVHKQLQYSTVYTEFFAKKTKKKQKNLLT